MKLNLKFQPAVLNVKPKFDDYLEMLQCRLPLNDVINKRTNNAITAVLHGLQRHLVAFKFIEN